MINTKPSIFDLDFKDVFEFIKNEKEPDYRAEQIWKGLYHNLYSDAESYSNLPRRLINKLSERYSFSNLTPLEQINAKDGQTIKFLFQLSDQKTIETVLMYYNKRCSLCISTQVGCAMGCTFCATGQMGFLRHLSSGEIVEQVIFFARYLSKNRQILTNIVLMGMGEPFHNYRATIEAIDRLNDQSGFNFGARRFTISTVGIIPMIKKFALENRQINLAVSLHAADNDLRSALIPVNRKYPLQELMDVCKFYVSTTKRRISFEWALIDGINDDIKQAELLTQLISGLLCHVNLILLNPTNKSHHKPSDGKKAVAFKNFLIQKGVPCSIRLRRGIEIRAGCGQLAARR
ncbi:MAG: 23S rRNA (adenine(2503)-C(2))-methyltransferase RlmN [Chloroflexi bacterium]|nr:23S rRNA (adenine(2503)-C(2))-methyltransferase RlmN [Chloroflexota bacterium]